MDWNLIGAAIAAGLSGFVGWYLSKARRAASDRADIESDNARGDTYEIVSDALKKQTERADRLEKELAEANKQVTDAANMMRSFRQLLKVDATLEQIDNFFKESGMAPLDK
jgi:plasmid stabilization system protein ParE